MEKTITRFVCAKCWEEIVNGGGGGYPMLAQGIGEHHICGKYPMEHDFDFDPGEEVDMVEIQISVVQVIKPDPVRLAEQKRQMEEWLRE